MKVKLIKHGHSYAILSDDKLIAFAHPEDFSNDHTIGKLSKENCDEIFGIIDVDDLAYEYSTMKMFIDSRATEAPTVKEIEDAEYISEIAFKDGFNKSMELNKEKVFTLEDMREAVYEGIKIGNGTPFVVPATDDYLKSLQQPTEIDVEIVIDNQLSLNDNKINLNYNLPKLDSKGCLILKKL